jgi:hypothetical protein
LLQPAASRHRQRQKLGGGTQPRQQLATAACDPPGQPDIGRHEARQRADQPHPRRPGAKRGDAELVEQRQQTEAEQAAGELLADEHRRAARITGQLQAPSQPAGRHAG